MTTEKERRELRRAYWWFRWGEFIEFYGALLIVTVIVGAVWLLR